MYVYVRHRETQKKEVILRHTYTLLHSSTLDSYHRLLLVSLSFSVCSLFMKG